jgi:hypothetical protein
MNPFLPDWMFAAFAIGGWELFHYLSKRLSVPRLVWVGDGIVAVCILVLLCRYLIRYLRRRKTPELPPDEDEWKKY